MASKPVDLFMVYQIMKRIVTPFNKWDAFKLGIIDAHGTVLRPKETLRRQEELDAWGYFDVMTANLKKLLAKVPGGSSTLTQTAAAILLLREGIVGEDFELKLKVIEEEVAANAVGGGAIAGIGVGADGEPGVPKKRKRVVFLNKILRRKMGQKNG